MLTLLHLSLHGPVKMYTWTITENSISLLESTFERVLSYAHIQTLYIWRLLYPFKLSYDWGWPCVEHITAISDLRNAGTLLLAVSMVGICVYALTQRNAVLMWSLTLVVVPLIPASNLFFPVGTILAERLLYVPSMGFCLFAGYLMAQLLDENPAVGMGRVIKRGKHLLFTLLCVYTCLMGLKSRHRSSEWKNEGSLFESALNVCPKSLKVLNNYAQLFLKTDPHCAIPFLGE
jgi:hypothetical protein